MTPADHPLPEEWKGDPDCSECAGTGVVALDERGSGWRPCPRCCVPADRERVLVAALQAHTPDRVEHHDDNFYAVDFVCECGARVPGRDWNRHILDAAQQGEADG